MTSYQKLAAVLKKKAACDLVRDLVLKHGMAGCKSSDVAKQLGICRETVGDHLRSLEAQGIVERTIPKGPQLLWGPVGIKARYIGDKKPWPSIRLRAIREKERRELERLGDDAELLPIKRVIVPAHQARPMLKPGIASVWELAA